MLPHVPPTHPAHAIVGELQRDLDRWREKVAEFEMYTIASTAGEPDRRAAELEAEVRELAVDIASYVDEMRYLGVDVSVERLLEGER